MDKLLYVTRQLRQLPLVDPDLPTFVLAGAPNVGKSSLVSALSTGQPEVCNYPFTTRSIKVSQWHIYWLRSFCWQGRSSGSSGRID